MAQPKIGGVGHGAPRMLYASDGSNWYAILVDSDGHVKVDVVSAALGTDGATAANQATMITALQLIDDLRAALGSVNTDDLQVDVKTYPGSNTLGNFPFGYYDRYAEAVDWVLTAADEGKSTTVVPAGEVWVLNSASIKNNDGAATDLSITAYATGVAMCTLAVGQGVARWVPVVWNGQIVLKAEDNILFYVSSGAIGEDIDARVWGYKMKIA